MTRSSSPAFLRRGEMRDAFREAIGWSKATRVRCLPSSGVAFVRPTRGMASRVEI